jgi:CHAD domain-containing protein
VDEAFADLRWKKVNADPQMPPSVHAMRIAFKKFRYMLEVAIPLVPPMPPTRPRVLQRYQGMMGQIQDSTVLLNFLDRFGAENPQFDIAPVVEFVIQKRDEQMEYFFDRIDSLDRFWRKSAGVRFPWRAPASLPETNQNVEVEIE